MVGSLSEPCRAEETILLGSLDVSLATQGWASPVANQSINKTPLLIAGQKFASGLGTHAVSLLYLDLQGGTRRFTASVGVDDEAKADAGSVEFHVYGDGKLLWKSKVLRSRQVAEQLDVNLTGVKTLLLLVGDAGDNIGSDLADWGDAKFVVTGAKPKTIPVPAVPAAILTPKALPKPRINGATVFGVRPGSPFLFTVAATGTRPLTFAAKDLPQGLKLDAQTGQISGVLKQKGEAIVTLRAANAAGADLRKLKIVGGDKLALTPPMGWNSWNCFAAGVDDAKVRASADAMVSSGLANHGWTYINIDDCWAMQGDNARDPDGKITSNGKFPNMKALCDYIHAKGLKAGIYSSPGKLTCAGFPASYQHEEQDAQRYAEWGFDYLKYDWCSYSEIAKDKSLPELKKPYLIMRAELNKVRRDIIYSMCQYGTGDVWQWGGEVGGNSWRTTMDITDTWTEMGGIGFTQGGREKFAGPGHWNDPDMLVVGQVGWGNLHPTKLTPNEQYTHLSLWSLLAAPLLLGCDLTKLDEFTLGLLTNDEVLDVNQDPLGQQARRVAQVEPTEVWAKKMQDGSMAVGLFNRGIGTFNGSDFDNPVTVKWEDAGISGKQIVRDLWRQKDLGEFTGSFTAKVPRHGVLLLRIRPAGKPNL